MKTFVTLAYLLLMARVGFAQDVPENIAKKSLPKKAVCVICNLNGEGHNEEKVSAGVMYKGKAYYFCNLSEVETFKKAPASFLPPVLPRPAPDTLGTKLEGGAVALSEYEGKIVLVDFWATWCVPCVKAMPEMQKLHDKYADTGFSVIGISIDEEGIKKVKPFLAKRKFTYPMLLDTNTKAPVWKAYGVHGVPALFLIDRAGQIVQQWTGKIDSKVVAKAVTELVETEKPSK